MLKTLMLPLIALLALASTGLIAGELRDYPVDRISPSTYVIHGPLGHPSVENQGFMNNPAFIVTDQGVIVIDPGSSLQAGEMVLRQIRTITDRPVTHVFSTHIHGDHWLGNHAIVNAYPKAVLYAHPKMIEKAHAGEAQSWLDLMARSTDGFTKGTEARIPDIEVTDSQQLTLHGKRFRIYAPGKAHSGTDVMIEFVDESVVFLGDNVLRNRIARMDDATFRGNSNACQVAIDIAASHYVPGHGPTGDVALVVDFKRFLDTLYSEVGRLYGEGLSDYEMKPQIMQALNDYAEWVGFEDAVGKQISLALLEVEQSAFE